MLGIIFKSIEKATRSVSRRRFGCIPIPVGFLPAVQFATFAIAVEDQSGQALLVAHQIHGIRRAIVRVPIEQAFVERGGIAEIFETTLVRTLELAALRLGVKDIKIIVVVGATEHDGRRNA